jgi:hypothetical protein
LTQPREKTRPTFDIFITAGGHARYVETLKNLAAARNRLKQLARNASGHYFIYSKKSGVVELIVHLELRERLSKAQSSHVIRGRLAS